MSRKFNHPEAEDIQDGHSRYKRLLAKGHRHVQQNRYPKSRNGQSHQNEEIRTTEEGDNLDKTKDCRLSQTAATASNRPSRTFTISTWPTISTCWLTRA
jgi:murein L,D-transpeptidase YafK